jgi:orotidine-5'-phosphate decarboxylase
MRNPIYCAIDTADYDEALAIHYAVRGEVGGIKVGLEFFAANGPLGVTALAGHDAASIFLDLKLHDIPNTVGKAVRALDACPYDILTVHCAGGRDMMRAAKQAAHGNAKVVGVTVLTSMDVADLAATGIAGDPAEQVERLAGLARSAGLDGIVCSALEVASVRAAWPEAFLVVPGIRPEGSAAGDQKRAVTPRQAMAAGASVLVIGRPITEEADPAAAARAIVASL